MDKYQERYTAHQARKKKILVQIMRDRYSERIFSDKPVEDEKLSDLLKVIDFCPSSCNRKAVSSRVVVDRDEKALLGGLLVGGVGWIHRAPAIILLFADPKAYKAGDEITYMPYLDAGVVIQQLYLMATAIGLSIAYANPNVRDANKAFFAERFGDEIYCGALAIGYKEPA